MRKGGTDLLSVKHVDICGVCESYLLSMSYLVQDLFLLTVFSELWQGCIKGCLCTVSHITRDGQLTFETFRCRREAWILRQPLIAYLWNLEARFKACLGGGQVNET